MVHRNVVISIEPPPGPNPRPYEPEKVGEVELALLEAMHWLEVNAILLPASDPNGQNGWRILGRRGREFLNRENFDNFKRAAQFPKSMLHPLIADRVWISLARGELDTAVFFAFRTVEERVRNAGNYSSTDIGVKLMRKAFNPDDGPLTDLGQPKPERESLMHFFAGSIGSYKNPHSHRTINIEDQNEAQEMVLLASHLLRIVDYRQNVSES